MKRDPYEVLGVAKDASAADIKAAYRSLAQQLHPDKNPEDPNATTLFVELGEAFEVLANPERRAHYDAHGYAPPLRDQAAALLNDLFRQYLGSTDERDPLTSLREAFNKQLGHQKAQLTEQERQLGRLKRYRAGLKPTTAKDTIMPDLLSHQEAAAVAQLGSLKNQLKVFEEALAILNEWEMPYEGPAPRYVGMGSFLSGTRSSGSSGSAI